MTSLIPLATILSVLALVHEVLAFSPDQLRPCFERYDGHKLFDAVPFHSEWRMTREEMCLPFCARTPSRCASIVYDKMAHICYYFSVKGIQTGNIERSPKRVYLEVAEKKCMGRIDITVSLHRAMAQRHLPSDDMLAIMESAEIDEKGETGTVAESAPLTTATPPITPEPEPMLTDVSAAYGNVSNMDGASAVVTVDSSLGMGENGTDGGNAEEDQLNAFISVIESTTTTTNFTLQQEREGEEETGGRSYTETAPLDLASFPPPETHQTGGGEEILKFGEGGIGEPVFIPIVSGFKAVRRPVSVVDHRIMPPSSGGNAPSPDGSTDSEPQFNEPMWSHVAEIVEPSLPHPSLKARKEPIEVRRHPTVSTTTGEQIRRTPMRIEPVIRPKISNSVLQPAPSIISIVPSNQRVDGSVRSSSGGGNVHVVDPTSPTSHSSVGSWDGEGLSVISTTCQRDSNQIWLAVENSQPDATLLESTPLPLVKSAPAGASDCIQACAALAHVPSTTANPCDSFTYLEREKQCVLHSLGSRFPYPVMVPAQRLDFSSRLFHRFCYPRNLPPFANCAEFLGFRDYSLEVEPKEMFNGLPTGREGLSACVELCVLASNYQCKVSWDRVGASNSLEGGEWQWWPLQSASFDSSAGICQLFNEHSLSRPADFREHQLAGVLYFENGCVDVEPIVGTRPETSEYRRKVVA